MSAASAGVAVRVGVSVVEVRPSSFDLAIRIRPLGDGVGPPSHGRCTIVIVRCHTGERVPITRDARDEFIARQVAARDLC